MEALHLNIEDRIRTDLNPLSLLQIGCQRLFIFVFDLKKPVQDLFVTLKRKQLLKLRCILFLLFSDGLIEKLREQRITVQQPPAECNTVCLIVKLLRIDPVEVVQLGILQDIRVERRNAVYAEAIVDINMRHMHRIISVNDRNTLVLKFPSHLII